jgi:hypothetical protein
MEENALKKDQTPYLIFSCKKCHQYSYVKTSQKTKKCLRCGRSHQVNNILNEGDIIYGMTQAVNAVKQKQNEFAIPEFRSQGDYIITTNRASNKNTTIITSKKRFTNESEKEIKFKALLHELSNLYGKFPAYMIEIMAENNGISSQELPHLIKIFKKQGILVLLKDEDFYYKISNKI